MSDSHQAMSRRRFLAVVGGTGGAVGIAGLVGWRALIAASGAPAKTSADEGLLAVEVEAGFVGAAGWNGDLLTLRPANTAAGGMLLRAELSGVEHHVEVPEGFAGRCVGTVGDTAIIGGHRVVETGRMTYEPGTPYETLIADAGPVSELLVGEPVVPHLTGYTYALVESLASVVMSTDLESWQHFDLPLIDGRGGSFGAVLGRGKMLAADSYDIAEVTDSVYEATLISISDAAEGRVAVVREPIPIDHGSLWGSADGGIDDIIVVSDRDGTRGYASRGGLVFEITDSAELLGVEPARASLDITVRTDSGRRETRRYRDGNRAAIVPLNDSDPVRHRIAPDVTVVAPDGQQSLVPNAQVARPSGI
ncbi:MAG: hypothetical protein OXF61_16195 [Acidimicrobiaceae bacterium]|nr:hypothetical protein [Acidimicrobiaceae bacterium]